MASGGTKFDVKAAIGCFVQNGNEKTVYAVVCKHVTNAANKFSVRGTPFATVTQKTKETRETTPTFNHFDIDLVKVEINQVQNCKPVFRDAHGDIRKARIFKGELRSLCPVFACFNNARNEDERRTGKVLPMSEVDETIRESYSSDTHFVVEGDSFATAGYSGRVVAHYDAKSDEGFIELLGMIVHKTGSQTVCLKLDSGFKHLNEEYGFNLSLCEPENYTGDENACVETGDYINF
jgi:hypothetical protein